VRTLKLAKQPDGRVAITNGVAAGLSDGDLGDIVASGSGTVLTIDNNAVTLAKMAQVDTNKLLGRSTAGTGNVELIDCTAAGRALLDDADASAQRTTLGLGTIATLNSPLPIANGGTASTSAGAALTALGAEATGVAAGLDAAHVAASDPHTQYRKAISVGRRADTANGASFQTLRTISIPGGTLGSDNGVAFEFRVRRTTGAGTLTWRLLYGGSTMVAFTASTVATTKITGVLFGDGATNAQRMHAEESRSVAPATSVTAAVDSTADQDLVLQVDFGTDGDVVTLDFECVEAVR
jgi:hypothetical protein